jgi:hypothetical protein
MKKGRQEEKSPKIIEFERIQQLTQIGIKKEDIRVVSIGSSELQVDNIQN